MSTRRYRAAFRLPFTRARPADVDEEFQFHLAMRAAELERQGHPAGRAREIAVAEFGDIDDARRTCRAEDERRMREYRRGLHMDSIWQDLRLAARTMRRQPGFALVTILTLGVAIALAASAYGVVHAYLVRPLPYREPARTVLVRAQVPDVPAPNVQALSRVDWTVADSVFAETVEWNLDAFTVVGRDHAESVRGAWVSPGYFSALGMRAEVGRLFTVSEYEGVAPVALISDALWNRLYGRDASVVGRAIRLQSAESEEGAELVTVVGVMSPDTWHTTNFTEVLRPLGERGFPIMAVVPPGVSMREAEERLNALVLPQVGTVDPAWRLSLIRVQDEYTARLRPTLVALLSGALFLLLIAAASVAGAQTARAAGRTGEVQVRMALGASRGRVVRQLVTETLILAVTAGVLGAAIAGIALATFGAAVGEQLGAAIPGGAGRLSLGVGPLALIALIGALLGAVIGLLPAVAVTRAVTGSQAPNGMLGSGKGSARSTASPALRRGLIVAQVAFTMMLLVGAGLMGRTILVIATTPLGFDDEHVVKGDVFLPVSRYRDAGERRRGAERVLESVRSEATVRDVALSTPDPLRIFTLPLARVRAEGMIVASDSGRPAAGFTVSPGYFDVLDIPLLAGRRFAPSDDESSPRAAIVSRSLARALWPEGAAVGRRIRVDGDSLWRTVVGVVGEIREPVESTPVPELYLPATQEPQPLFTVLARVTGPAAEGGPVVQRAVSRTDDLLGVASVRPLRELTDRAMNRHRALASVLSLFALLALGLAMLGLYASLSYVVAQRRREIAIRVSVGANDWAIRGLVLREGLALVAAGLALGVALSLALTGLLASQLYGVTPTDPGTFGAIVALLGVSALAASLAPIRQATRVQPAEIMRSE